MSRFYGLNPGPAARKAIEQFENEVLIRHNNLPLVGSVYVDMEETRWAVAIAYNLSHNPGLRGRENALEVRYSYAPSQRSGVRMFRSDIPGEAELETEPFGDQDAFIRYAVGHERRLLNR